MFNLATKVATVSKELDKDTKLRLDNIAIAARSVTSLTTKGGATTKGNTTKATLQLMPK